MFLLEIWMQGATLLLPRSFNSTSFFHAGNYLIGLPNLQYDQLGLVILEANQSSLSYFTNWHH